MFKAIKSVRLNDSVIFGDNKRPFVLMAGPCVLEDVERTWRIASRVKEICTKLAIPYVFKASFDKANRSSIESYRGPGLEKGLDELARIKHQLNLPILTDVHTAEQADKAAEIVDILQIPAFLSRQTDLLVAAGQTDKLINVKKGQFLAPWDIEQVVKKIENTGNNKILLTERGVSFGYNNLVVDMRSLPRMRETGYPVVFDATHSVQLPGGAGNVSGGDSEFVPYLTRAAVGVGIDALFMEVHDNPEEALSDGPNMVSLDKLEGILKQALAIDSLVKDR